MIIYKDLLTKVLLVCSIILFVVVASHILITTIHRNYMDYNTILMFTLGVLSVLTISALTFFCAKSVDKTNTFQNILYDECNALKAIDETYIQLDNVMTSKNIATLKLYLTTCYFSIGDYNEAMSMYKANDMYKSNVSIDIKMMWYHNYAMTAIKVYDTQTVEILREYFKKLQVLYPKKRNKLTNFLESQDRFQAFVNNDFSNIAKYYEQELSTAKTKLEKVIYNAYLTRINKSLNNNYIKNMEFVLNNSKDLIYTKDVQMIKDGN